MSRTTRPRGRHQIHSFMMDMVTVVASPNLSLNPDASPAALARRPLGAG